MRGVAPTYRIGTSRRPPRISGAPAGPAHQIAVSELADSSVNFVVRMWCKKEDYWGIKFDMTHAIKEAFDKNDLEIPFPQRVVHHVNAG